MPSLQSLEQQSVLFAHGLPDVLHDALSAVHLPASHLPPQHSPSAVHAAVSAVHCFSPHLPPTHAPLQQSVFAAHASAGDLQPFTEGAHCFVVWSQLRVPHSTLFVHGAPASAEPPELPGPDEPELPSGPPSFALIPSSSLSLPQPAMR